MLHEWANTMTELKQYNIHFRDQEGLNLLPTYSGWSPGNIMLRIPPLFDSMCLLHDYITEYLVMFILFYIYLMMVLCRLSNISALASAPGLLRARKVFGWAWSPEGPKGPRESPMQLILMLGLNPEVFNFHQKRNLGMCLPAYTICFLSDLQKSGFSDWNSGTSRVKYFFEIKTVFQPC